MMDFSPEYKHFVLGKLRSSGPDVVTFIVYVTHHCLNLHQALLEDALPSVPVYKDLSI